LEAATPVPQKGNIPKVDVSQYSFVVILTTSEESNTSNVPAREGIYAGGSLLFTPRPRYHLRQRDPVEAIFLIRRMARGWEEAEHYTEMPPSPVMASRPLYISEWKGLPI